MNVICKVCDGKGKVDKDFACGKCKELDPKEYFYRECPACNGSGMQYEKDPYSPSIIFPKPYPKKYKPYDPWKIPSPVDPCPFPYDPFRHPPKRKKRYWRISGYTSTT
jgi:hypothetical protein